ncbi:MAG TPA: ATP synthase F0 subunit C [Isosphaeraceae bacterium]|jgi:F-type H+-transporting ATPase subunit c
MRFAKTAVLALALVLLAQVAAHAQAPAAGGADAAAAGYRAPFSELRGIGVGLVIIGAAMGIGGLTKSAVESMARQPETAANVQTAMIISAALIEGVTFFALIIIGFILTA